MSRLTNLKPRVATLNQQRVQTIRHLNPTATPRQRGRPWQRRREEWLRDHPLCAACESRGEVAQAEEVDHVIPLEQGGADDESNLQSLCIPCHKDKSAREASARASLKR